MGEGTHTRRREISSSFAATRAPLRGNIRGDAQP